MRRLLAQRAWQGQRAARKSARAGASSGQGDLYPPWCVLAHPSHPPLPPTLVMPDPGGGMRDPASPLRDDALHPARAGIQALVEQWVATLADLFVGTEVRGCAARTPCPAPAAVGVLSRSIASSSSHRPCTGRVHARLRLSVCVHARVRGSLCVWACTCTVRAHAWACRTLASRWQFKRTATCSACLRSPLGIPSAATRTRTRCATRRNRTGAVAARTRSSPSLRASCGSRCLRLSSGPPGTESLKGRGVRRDQ